MVLFHILHILEQYAQKVDSRSTAGFLHINASIQKLRASGSAHYLQTRWWATRLLPLIVVRMRLLSLLGLSLHLNSHLEYHHNHSLGGQVCHPWRHRLLWGSADEQLSWHCSLLLDELNKKGHLCFEYWISLIFLEHLNLCLEFAIRCRLTRSLKWAP